MAKSAYAVPRYLTYPCTPCPNDGVEFDSCASPANAAARAKVPRSNVSMAAILNFSFGVMGLYSAKVGDVRKLGIIQKIRLSGFSGSLLSDELAPGATVPGWWGLPGETSWHNAAGRIIKAVNVREVRDNEPISSWVLDGVAGRRFPNLFSLRSQKTARDH